MSNLDCFDDFIKFFLQILLYIFSVIKRIWEISSRRYGLLLASLSSFIRIDAMSWNDAWEFSSSIFCTCNFLYIEKESFTISRILVSEKMSSSYSIIFLSKRSSVQSESLRKIFPPALSTSPNYAPLRVSKSPWWSSKKSDASMLVDSILSYLRWWVSIDFSAAISWVIQHIL